MVSYPKKDWQGPAHQSFFAYDNDKGLKARLPMTRPISVYSTGLTIKREKIYLTQWELKGLNMLVDWLDTLAPSKKCVPKDITDPSSLLNEMKVTETFLFNLTRASLNNLFIVF